MRQKEGEGGRSTPVRDAATHPTYTLFPKGQRKLCRMLSAASLTGVRYYPRKKIGSGFWSRNLLKNYELMKRMMYIVHIYVNNFVKNHFCSVRITINKESHLNVSLHFHI